MLRGAPAARVVMAGLAITVLLSAVAVASRTDLGWREERGEPRGVPQAVIDYGFTIAIVLAVAFAAFVLVSIVLAPSIPVAVLLESRKILLGLVLVTALAGAIFAVTDLRRIQRDPVEQSAEAEAARREREARPARSRDRRRPAEFKWEVVVVAGALLLIGGAAAAAARRRRVRPAVEERERLVEDLSAALDDSLDDLYREQDARRAVIASYARMERVLAAHGLPRRPFEAPFEYLARILRELKVRAGAALALTELFQRAKFSRREVDPAMKDEAIAALVSVRDDLRASA